MTCSFNTCVCVYIYRQRERERESHWFGVYIETMTTEKRNFPLLDSKENIVEGKTKPDGTKKGLCESTLRKRLDDITNLPRKSKLATCADKAQFLPNTDKVDIDKLQKENTSLLELLADKNKIIELNEIELQKANMNMQKMQQQNFQLAQANTMMLAELNAGKDRLKVMQHQLGCKNSLLRVKEMELAEQLKIRTCKQRENQVGMSKSEKDVMENKEVDRHQNNCCNNRKRQQKSQCLGHYTVKNEELKEETENERVCVEAQPASFKPGESEPIEDIVASKHKAENKRGCLRKSAMFRQKEPKPKEDDMFEMTDPSKLSECSSSLNSQESSTSQSIDGHVLGKPIARPLRVAAKKVQSYKEIPLKVKLRRPE